VTCRVVIPAKAKAQGKSRLAAVLASDERERLIDAMLAHVIEVARGCRSVAEVCVVGPAREGLPQGILMLPDPGEGLNAALTAALTVPLPQTASGQPDRVIVLAADLPSLSTGEVDQLCAAPPSAIAIASDRHRTGTNALSLPLPEAAGFRFAFGAGSYALHCEEARRLGLMVNSIHSPGLANDIDEPADLAELSCAVQRV
jgi:2-phospho-L-lactate guanylyltransferase